MTWNNLPPNTDRVCIALLISFIGVCFLIVVLAIV